MKGFVTDYVENYPAEAAQGPEGKPTYKQYRTIMDSYPPERVSVLSELAKGFAVFDNWHCSVPSQTWCNRAFWHAATSYGQVINGPSLKWFCGSKAPNLFTRLVTRFGDPSSRKHPAERTAWRIYSPAWNFFSLTAFLHLRALFHYADQEHIRDLEGFFEDCGKGALPRYSFLEPQFLFQHNDQHPSSIKGLTDGPTHAGSVLLGELLIWRIYDAVRRSHSKTGNNAQNTLLIITHDEHGGCFDHMPPGSAVPPSGKPKPGQDCFTFGRLGVRVPMVMVSAHIRPGTILSETLDHTSFLRTMAKKWHLEPLTARDSAAQPFTGVFNAADPRPAADWPTPAMPVLPVGWEKDEGFRREGLHGMQRDLLRAAALVHGLSRKPIDKFETLGEAHETMRRLTADRSDRRSSLWRILVSLLLR
jgi:phospholipase C